MEPAKRPSGPKTRIIAPPVAAATVSIRWQASSGPSRNPLNVPAKYT
ncbi:hypothetical protein GCM10017566_00750 [Amycolatopsis bartoniae]|uniref:Uncharacterized protein n=1 Tax=Amycolatopsis bartoniae TaxID=941986 RepID=A0A8H9ISF8_9PSEU|nr:hypothetical protein GCM10017566_00750 [Amycolatopsis bartoniae]